MRRMFGPSVIRIIVVVRLQALVGGCCVSFD